MTLGKWEAVGCKTEGESLHLSYLIDSVYMLMERPKHKFMLAFSGMEIPLDIAAKHTAGNGSNSYRWVCKQLI